MGCRWPFSSNNLQCLFSVSHALLVADVGLCTLDCSSQMAPAHGHSVPSYCSHQHHSLSGKGGMMDIAAGLGDRWAGVAGMKLGLRWSDLR